VLLYATGHEGRGIGLVNKLQAYLLQDGGLDTLDANRHLGFPPDARDYREAAACLAGLGVRTVRLLTNNPHKETSRGGRRPERRARVRRPAPDRALGPSPRRGRRAGRRRRLSRARDVA